MAAKLTVPGFSQKYIVLTVYTLHFLLEKHDRGELEWPCTGTFSLLLCVRDTVLRCAVRIHIICFGKYICVYSLSWQTTPSCRSCWWRCWWSTVVSGKPPSGRCDTESPNTDFLLAYGKHSRVYHSELDQMHKILIYLLNKSFPPHFVSRVVIYFFSFCSGWFCVFPLSNANTC